MKEKPASDLGPAGENAAAARAFAVNAHGSQKYADQPFSVHLDDVALRARQLGFITTEHQVVAYLHDVLKDTAVTAAELEERFGYNVRVAVEQLTRPADYDHGVLRMTELAFSVKLAELQSEIMALGSGDNDAERALLSEYTREIYACFRTAYRHGKAYLDALDVVSHESIVAAVHRVPMRDPAAFLSGHFIVGERPVKVVKTGDNQIDVLAYDWATGGFVRDASYLAKVTFGWGEVDKVTPEEFEATVERLRTGRS